MNIQEVYEKIKEKNFPYFQLKEETERDLDLPAHEMKKIVVSCDWNDFENVYEVYEIRDYYLVHIVEKYVGLGSEAADCITNRWQIESKNWITTKTEKHWEDLVVYEILPKRANFAKYLLKIPFPDGYRPIREMEYQDWRCDYDDDMGAREA